MKGWKTWLAVIAAMGYAVGGYVLDMHDADKMIELAIAAMALVGIGGKLDKASSQIQSDEVGVMAEIAADAAKKALGDQSHWLTDLGFESLEDAKKHYASSKPKPEEPHV